MFHLQYEELSATGEAHKLSPRDLERRFLVKGKVKTPKLKRSASKAAVLTRHVSSYLSIMKMGGSCLARTGSCIGLVRRKSSLGLKRKESQNGGSPGLGLMGLRRKHSVIEGGAPKGMPHMVMRRTSYDDALADEMLRDTSCTEDRSTTERLTTERLTEDALDEGLDGDELRAGKSRSISAGNIAAEFDARVLQTVGAHVHLNTQLLERTFADQSLL